MDGVKAEREGETETKRGGKRRFSLFVSVHFSCEEAAPVVSPFLL